LQHDIVTVGTPPQLKGSVMMQMEPADELAIRALAHDYFDAVDRGDGDRVGVSSPPMAS
jgi:hypothetical protein